MGRVWITGGSGFVGRHLARELLARGREVWSIDRPESGTPPEGTHALELELAQDDAVVAALAETRPNAVVHLAAQSSGGLSFSIPRQTFRNNVESALGLLEALRRRTGMQAGRVRLLAVGSCEEYGAPASEEELPLKEDQPLRPRNPYAVSKAAQTLLCGQYRRAHGVEVLSTRSFTHTGPGQSDRFVFSSFARQVAQLERDGGGILRVGNLDVSRDVSDVRDVARAYSDLLEVDWPHAVVNVCSGRELGLRHGIEILRDATRVPIEVEVDPARLRPADVPRFVGDPARLRAMIGWTPRIPAEQTIRDLLDWWRERVVS